MGQQSSKSHAPLTFGYINQNNNNEQQEEVITLKHYLNVDQMGINTTSDFVLDNPHLYKLEFKCQHCSNPNNACRFCKRLSLLHRDLANDLNYIDQTYYPNIVHYGSKEGDITAATSINELDNEGWSKLTIGDITSSTSNNISKILISSSQLSIDLSGKSLVKLSSSIGYLDNITKLDLSDNQIIHLPKAIGKLINLRILNASKNQLSNIPDTIVNLKKIKAINLSHNRISNLPIGIGNLPSLIIIIMNHNQLIQLPREIANLNDLITLNVSNNPLKSIPAEIATLKSLRKLIAEDCSFETEFIHQISHNSPTLFEICARNIVKSNITLPPFLTCRISDYFKRKQTCSFCFGPYFDYFITRGRFIERTGRQLIALDYKLCCSHWNDEKDRISTMFSTTTAYNRRPTDILTVEGAVEGAPVITPRDDFTTTHHHHHSSAASSSTSTTSSSSSSLPTPPIQDFMLSFATLNDRRS